MGIKPEDVTKTSCDEKFFSQVNDGFCILSINEGNSFTKKSDGTPDIWGFNV